MILLDTNFLGRLTDFGDLQRESAVRAMRTLFKNGEQLAIVPQNLYEFWAVATRMPDANGLGLTVEQASQWLRFFLRRFTLLPDREDLVQRWHDLVRTHGITSFRAHDARLVAAMQCYGVTRLLKFNDKDFRALGVEVVDPAAV